MLSSHKNIPISASKQNIQRRLIIKSRIAINDEHTPKSPFIKVTACQVSGAHLSLTSSTINVRRYQKQIEQAPRFRFRLKEFGQASKCL